MEIYSFKLKSSKNSNIFIVSTDTGDFLLLSDIIVKYGIEKGKINDNIFNEAVEQSKILIATNLAMKYLGSRLKTEKQVKDYLYKKEFHKFTVDSVIEKLKEYKVIDDSVYADAYIKSNKNYSKNKLKQKLQKAGVKQDIREELTAEIDDLDSCIIHAEKYMRNKILDKNTRDKLIRHLMSKGYTWDTINTTLNKLKFSDEE